MISPCSQYTSGTLFLGAKSYSVSPPGQDSISTSGPLPYEPTALGLPGVPRRLYPGPRDVAVLGDPSLRAHQRVVLVVDRVLQAVDLLLGERQRVHERVGYGVLLPQAPAHDGRAFGRVVRRAHSVFGVLQIPDIVPLIHPVRRPGEEDELFLEGI